MKRDGRQKTGFTLIEMLVVIAIIALLAALIVPGVNRVRRSARVTEALSAIRECGTLLLAEAADNEGKLLMHIWGSSSGMQDYRMWGIVQRRLGDIHHTDDAIARIIRTPAYRNSNETGSNSWMVWGVNFEDNAENGVYWTPSTIAGLPQNVHMLRTYGVVNPAVYPLLGDSSDQNGVPYLRMSRIGRDNRMFALRYDEKGPIFLLDGSAKMIGEEQMETYTLRMGYRFARDNPTTNPTRFRAY